MNIMITGATGMVGSELTKALLEAGHKVWVPTRDVHKGAKALGKLLEGHSGKLNIFNWDPKSCQVPPEIADNLDGVVNLMGENLAAKRWSDSQKKLLRDSRVLTTIALSKNLAACRKEPLKFWVQASAIGIYPVNLAQKLDESASFGHEFLSELCREWEAAGDQVSATRKVTIRIGIVLSKKGGALGKLLPLFKLGLGGPAGSGKQMMSWIDIEDLVQILKSSCENETWSGIFNAVSPEPKSNKEFGNELGKALNRPALFPAPGFALKTVLGEMSTIVLDGQEVIPQHLENVNFNFKYPTLSASFKHLLNS